MKKTLNNVPISGVSNVFQAKEPLASRNGEQGRPPTYNVRNSVAYLTYPNNVLLTGDHVSIMRN